MMECPSPAQLQKLFLNGQEAHDEAVDAHIEQCASCQQALEKIMGAASLVTARSRQAAPPPAGVLAESAFLRRLEQSPPPGALPGVGPAANADSLTAMSSGPPPAAPAAVKVQGYEIIRELGRGGMGIVYLARQRGLNRLVAIKMMMKGAHANDDDSARFRAEAEAVARLHHAHIVQIYEVGDADGCPFFSLEYVEGGSLADILKGSPQAPDDAVRLVQQLAEAMQYCHELGILHRDLKPSNILLATQQRAAAEATSLSRCVPKITDFGLAKRLGADGPTLTGAILGTPSYMPPEQAAGETAIGPAADVYSLGAILYELLTGQPPFRGFSSTMTLWQVVNEDPVPPRRLRPHIPADLETICLTCLQKEAWKRYATAAKLAEDLRAYQDGLPIQARPARLGERLLGWCRTHPSLSVIGGIGGVALVGVIVGLWFQSALAVGALAVVSLCLGAWWYSARLERALHQVRQQNLFYQPNVARMYLLLETVHRLLAAPQLDQRLRILGEATARLVNAERATIFLIDEARGELWSKLALGEQQTEIRVPIGAGIAGSVAQDGRIINLADPYHDPRFNPEVDRRTGFTTRNLLTVPMTDATGRRLGVLQVLNKRDGSFDSEDVEILSYLALSASLLVLPEKE